jgi:hypothetical protein
MAGQGFDLTEWRRCVLSIPPFPPFPTLRMAVDPAYSANPSSDDSSYCLGFLDEDSSFTLLDCGRGLWKGIQLPDKIVDALKKWDSPDVWIEKTGNGASDLLRDVIVLQCATREVTVPRISFYTPRTPKASRIRRLQGLVENDLLHISPTCPYGSLFDQALAFDFESKNKDNHRRPDDLLDALAAVCGFRD